MFCYFEDFPTCRFVQIIYFNKNQNKSIVEHVQVDFGVRQKQEHNDCNQLKNYLNEEKMIKTNPRSFISHSFISIFILFLFSSDQFNSSVFSLNIIENYLSEWVVVVAFVHVFILLFYHNDVYYNDFFCDDCYNCIEMGISEGEIQP